jgi:hypothetical protein
MPIASSSLVIDAHVQKDGSRYVKEIHVDSEGRSQQVLYKLPPGLTYSQHKRLMALLKKKDDGSRTTRPSLSSTPTKHCRKNGRRLSPSRPHQPFACRTRSAGALMPSCQSESALPFASLWMSGNAINRIERTRKLYS